MKRFCTKRIFSLILVLASVTVSLAGSGYAQTGRRLVVVSWGGPYQAAERQAVFAPFEKETGVRIVEQTPTSYGKLKAMVRSRNVEWDVVDAECDFIPRGARDGLLEKLDYAVINKSGILPEMVSPYGIGYVFAINEFAYNTKKYAVGQEPRSWQDFWDMTRFPGSRGMWKWPVTVMEAALLADGVPTTKLYPLDIDRAFQSLDKIKPHVTLWWDTAAQFVQALSDQEVVMSMVWSGSITEPKRKGVPIRSVYNQMVLTGECWVVPKGAKNRDLAMKFIAFASRPKPQAAHAMIIDNLPINTRAYQLLSSERAKELPTLKDRANWVIINGEWWLNNFDTVNDRFNQWLLKK
jgi:putative spermidine/putrescine transport system substrate-binding protein